MATKCNHGLNNNSFYNIWQPDKSSKLYKNEMLRYFHLLNLLPENITNVLDIGCGTGYMAYLMAKKNLAVTAVDIVEGRLTSFKAIADKYNIKQIKQDFFKLNFNHQFDAILSQEVLEHLVDYDRALITMSSFIKPNGYAVFCVPFKENLKAKTKKCPQCGLDYHSNGHLHSFSKEKFSISLLKANFKLLKLTVIVNKRTVKWTAKTKISVSKPVLHFDKLMNFLFSYKAAYLAALCQKEK